MSDLGYLLHICNGCRAVFNKNLKLILLLILYLNVFFTYTDDTRGHQCSSLHVVRASGGATSVSKHVNVCDVVFIALRGL